jgi:hypothetical protein
MAINLLSPHGYDTLGFAVLGRKVRKALKAQDMVTAPKRGRVFMLRIRGNGNEIPDVLAYQESPS